MRSAAKNTSITLLSTRLTVNPDPRPCPNAARRSMLTLSFAALQAEKKLHGGDSVFLGELGLDGTLRPCRALPAVRQPWMLDTTA